MKLIIRSKIMKCKIKNISINYEILGTGKPVLMIHGYYPDHRLMAGCMEPVFSARAGYKRIYFDLPGMGISESDAWNILENFPRATFCILDKAGHNLQIEQEELFNSLINEWLDRTNKQ
jgi:pimeloyl-ACP methyl ester carboxylesterase